MGGDYTRFTDRPTKGYAGVLMQQGRVQLDADWNEEIDILRRRWQTQAVDTFGPCAVPQATTPDGFKIGAVAGPPPDLTIGAGRLYVDGLLAEILPGEQVNGQPITYLNQPFFPAPPALTGLTGPNGLAYLDIWEREVTAIEDPDLLEKAMGGPDTTTRIQTVWQVKVKDFGTTAASCDTDLGFRPSGGRLSTRAVAPPASDDPCIIAPTGGFRGLENRLYRVEIHTPGDLTTARFKWSRENASVVSAVEQLASTADGRSILTVSRIGRDKVLRFAVDDWVEVLDDHRELMGEPGEMAQVKRVDEATRTLTLDRAIPAAGTRPFGADPSALRARHTRVRRWDQSDKTNAIVKDGGTDTGLVAVSGAFLPIEDGIEVQFALAPASDSSSGTFQVGDYWVFAARTADASVELLDGAPPRGILHHSCTLARLSGLGAGVTLAVQEDCRPRWPPCCSCCVVTVGNSARHRGDYPDLASALAAVPSLAPDPTVPVQICLLPGEYPLPSPVQITRNRVTITGCGRAARITATGTAFQVTGDEVALEFLAVARPAAAAPSGALTAGPTAAAPSPPLIEVHGNFCRLEGNELESGTGWAIFSRPVNQLTVRENRVEGGLGVSVSSFFGQIRRNRLTGGAALHLRTFSISTQAVENEIGNADGPAGIVLGTIEADDFPISVVAEIDLLDNRILSAKRSGIASAVPAGSEVRSVFLFGLHIVGNTIGENVVGPQAELSWTAGDPPFGGIVLDTVLDLAIRQNRILNNGALPDLTVPVCGIYVRQGAGLDVSQNHILNNGPAPGSTAIEGPQGGILVTNSAEFQNRPAVLIAGNLVDAPRGQAVLLRGTGALLVQGNRLKTRQVVQSFANANTEGGAISTVGGAVDIINSGEPSAAAGGPVQFVDNQVVLDLTAGTSAMPVSAVALISADDMEASDNQSLCRLSTAETAASTLPIDVLVFSGGTARVIGNGLRETQGQADFSLITWTSSLNTTADNQGTHCILVIPLAPTPDGRPRFVDRDNLTVLPCPGVRPVAVATIG